MGGASLVAAPKSSGQRLFPLAMEDAGSGEVAAEESHPTTMQSIADDALLEVLARVSSKSLLVAKAVSRRWYNLINDGRLQFLRRELKRSEEWLCLFDARSAGPIQGHVYVPNLSGWHAIKPLDEGFERVGFQALAMGPRVLILGGMVYEESWTETVLTSKVDIYDALADSWAPGTPMLTPRSYFACGLLDDGRLIVAGGDGDLKSAEIFDPEKNEWRRLPDMPTVSSRCVGQVLGGRFYVVRLANIRLPSTINAYDPTTDRWRVLDLPDWDLAGNPLLTVADWSEFGLGIVGPRQLAFVGGLAYLSHNAPFQVLDNVMTYDVDSQTVRQQCAMPPDLTTSRTIQGGRKGCICVTLGGALCVVGGSRRLRPVTWEKTRSILMLDSLGWRRIAQMPISPEYPLCAVIKMP